jgi:hypothetical protein
MRSKVRIIEVMYCRSMRSKVRIIEVMYCRSMRSNMSIIEAMKISRSFFFDKLFVNARVADPDWIRIQSGQWIRIRNPDSESGSGLRIWIHEGKNDPQK